MIKKKCDVCNLDLAVVIETDLIICDMCVHSVETEHELDNMISKVRLKKGLKVNTDPEKIK